MLILLWARLTASTFHTRPHTPSLWLRVLWISRAGRRLRRAAIRKGNRINFAWALRLLFSTPFTQATSRFKNVRGIHISPFNLQFIDYDPFIAAGDLNSRPDKLPHCSRRPVTPLSSQASLHHANLLFS